VKVLVVGGGIIGCATAYELAKAGCAVTLLERSTPGAEASSAAAGVLSPLAYMSHAPSSRLVLASWRLYPAIARELAVATGVDVELSTRGTIHPLFTVEEIRDAGMLAEWAVRQRLDVDAWDAADLRTREPALSTQVRGAMFVKADHWINNQRLVVAYAQAAVAAGVSLVSGCAVSRVIVEDGRARGVLADGDRFEGDVVVLAAGAWTGALAASFGGRLPVEPRRGQMVALGHVPPVIRHCIHANDVYLVPRPSGELLIGATVERVGFQRAVTAQAVAGLLTAAIDLVPALAGLPITRTWFGFRPWAPDGRPVLGPWPGIDNLWVATAHYREGILLAPITAKLLTEWIVGGAPSMDLDAFLPHRFAKD
jgi:glycine oxidase